MCKKTIVNNAQWLRKSVKIIKYCYEDMKSSGNNKPYLNTTLIIEKMVITRYQFPVFTNLFREHANECQNIFNIVFPITLIFNYLKFDFMN